MKSCKDSVAHCCESICSTCVFCHGVCLFNMLGVTRNSPTTAHPKLNHENLQPSFFRGSFHPYQGLKPSFFSMGFGGFSLRCTRSNDDDASY